MKKLGLAVAVASALGVTTTAVNAYTVAKYAHGLLVPYASFVDSSQGTVVGLISCKAGKIRWVYMDEDSKHITDGTVTVTKDDMYSFVLSEQGGLGLENLNGYLVFTLDVDADGATGSTHPDNALTTDDDDCLAGNAFYVNTAANDVQFVPTAPLDWSSTESASDYEASVVLDALDNESIRQLAAGAQDGEKIAMRYFIDNAEGGDDTNIVMWTVCKAKTTNTVFMFDDEQNKKSVNFDLPNDELNVVDPETIVGRPANFLDGFIVWEVNDASYPGSGSDSAYCDKGQDTAELDDEQAALSYSLISSPAFGAVQTLYNPHSHN